MLQVLDMSGGRSYRRRVALGQIYATFLPILPKQVDASKGSISGVLPNDREGSFSGCNNFTEADFSKATQLRSIGYSVFYECSGLRDLDLSACTSLVGIGSNAFYRCSNLQTVNLSGCGKLTSIESYAFQNCSSLRTVDLSNCTALATLGSGCV